MPLTREQHAALERLNEDETLTGELTDNLARSLLHWGEQQILAGLPVADVTRAMRAANHSGAETSPDLLAAAATRLAQLVPISAAAPDVPPQPVASPPVTAAPSPPSLWERLRRKLLVRRI